MSNKINEIYTCYDEMQAALQAFQKLPDTPTVRSAYIRAL